MGKPCKIMDTEELIEIFDALRRAGWKPMMCDAEVPYYEAAVRAGCPTEAWGDEAWTEMMAVPRSMLGTHPAFILDVVGDSMADAGIDEGDRVLVLMGESPRDGDIVVVKVEDGFTIKCYYEDDEGCHWLVPQNDKYKPILLDGQESVYVFGVVKQVMKSAPRVPSRKMLKAVNSEKERMRRQEEIPALRVSAAIREVAEGIDVSRLWFAVYRAMTDLSVVRDGDFSGFCEMVCAEVPRHGHLPVAKDLQRMDVESFTRSVVLWKEDKAPVQGKRFRRYVEIARLTESLLRDE